MIKTMEYCNDFRSFNGCGQCNLRLSQSNQIAKLKPYLFHNIIEQLFSFGALNLNKKIIIDESFISCIGLITVAYTEKREQDTRYFNRKVCKEFIESWYIYNKSLLDDAVCFLYMFKCLGILSSIDTENCLFQKAEELNTLINSFKEVEF